MQMKETHVFWQRQLTAKQLLHGRREEKLQKLNLSPLFGFWMGPNWVDPWALVETPVFSQ